LPETGILRKNFSEAAGQLKIRTQTESNNYFIKLVEQATGRETASAFIRSGSVLSHASAAWRLRAEIRRRQELVWMGVLVRNFSELRKAAQADCPCTKAPPGRCLDC